ncbi:uncharacterized protein CXQ87_001470 [Candidozyma duobushaemuli]|uniref:K Homology domain-containing protein n=1 Tax=Candidozyma duobushaemuli TaxID=1231522 RepID=A0A2V1AKW6_9ASCO|nr:uncharacterized protein CXQ87_001470 [[Candida] duobushaemulonis]PVH18539.1 hypothetical protein CXQ87_001470 [[Candida] duobushaemulonis]
MDSNLVILSLEYSYLLNPSAGLFESDCGLWQSSATYSPTLIHSAGHFRVLDNMKPLRETVRKLNHNGMGEENHVKLVEPQLNNQLITISINGSETFINISRIELLRAYHRVDAKKIVLSEADFANIGPEFVSRSEAIASRCRVELMVTDKNIDFKSTQMAPGPFGLYIAGPTENLSVAETECRILVDALLHGCKVHQINIPLSLLPGIGGVNLANFAEIARQSNVNIYLPSLMPHSFNCELVETSESSIWITAKKVPELLLAKRILSDLVATVDCRINSAANLYLHEIEIAKDKLDIITLYAQRDVSNIMFLHGTFIQIPSLGEAKNNKIIVQGHSTEAVSKTVQDISNLSCNYYSLDIRFPEGSRSPDFEYYLINLINVRKTCILTYNCNGMNIVGVKDEVRSLLKDLIAALQNTSLFTDPGDGSSQFRFSVSMELQNEHREFLSGKKNGKIIKILNQLNHMPQIRFRHLNEYNFLITSTISVSAGVKNKQMSSVFDILSKSVSLIEMELPAEMQFNIPEVFHKSIIGNGGSIIQSIMKKYNSEENPEKTTDDRILYSFRRDNNVLIKCPMKNSKNILFVKYEIDQLVAQCCSNTLAQSRGMATIYNSVGFRLLKSHYQMLIRKQGQDLRFVNDLETDFSTYIDFPTSLETFKGESSHLLAIKGNDNRPHSCALKLASMLPETWEFQVTFCPGKFDGTFSESNEDFREKVVIPFRLLLDVELAWNRNPVDSETQEPLPYHQVFLSSYNKANAQKAIHDLTIYLREERFLILDKQAMNFDPIVPALMLPPTPLASPLRSPVRSPTRSPTRSPERYSDMSTDYSRSPTRQPMSNSGSPKRSPNRPQALRTITNQPVNSMKKIPSLVAPLAPNFHNVPSQW